VAAGETECVVLDPPAANPEPGLSLLPVKVAPGGCKLINTMAPRIKQAHETISTTARCLFFLPMYLNGIPRCIL
jgi:hypothetical protein